MAEGIKKSQTRPRFNGKISAEFTPPKTWELEKGLSFITLDLTEAEIQTLQDVGANIAETGRITCKKGMKTDLASVPRIVWNILAPWDVARAAVIHDHLYASLRTYYNSDDFDKGKWSKARAIADKVFLLGMKASDPKVASYKMYSAYWSVRMFGGGPASGDTGEV